MAAARHVILGLVVLTAATAMALPSQRARRQLSVEEALGLPSNSTSIRANIVDTFSCQQRIYGYYADVDNDCQLFHVCLPVTLPDGTSQTFKYSFICPVETVFNQESLTCTYPTDAIPCADSPSLYSVNEAFGIVPLPPAKA